MQQTSMTALISAFSRAFHSENNDIKIFDDNIARKLFTDEEFSAISNHLTEGAGFFNATTSADKTEVLKKIVDLQLSPTPLSRQVFTEKSLETAVKIGAKQYLIFAAGFDTFAYRQPQWAKNINIFEIDHPFTAKDKKERLKRAKIDMPENLQFINADFTLSDWYSSLLENKCFSQNKVSFCSILGLSYYLSEDEFKNMLLKINNLIPKGSTIVFDYPSTNTSEQSQKQEKLASGAGEAMKVKYSYREIKKLMSDCGYLIYEHLNSTLIKNQFFSEYNYKNPKHKILPFKDVNFCLAVKK